MDIPRYIPTTNVEAETRLDLPYIRSSPFILSILSILFILTLLFFLISVAWHGRYLRKSTFYHLASISGIYATFTSSPLFLLNRVTTFSCNSRQKFQIISHFTNFKKDYKYCIINIPLFFFILFPIWSVSLLRFLFSLPAICSGREQGTVEKICVKTHYPRYNTILLGYSSPTVNKSKSARSCN